MESYNKLVDYRNPADPVGRWLQHVQRNFKIVWPRLPAKTRKSLLTLRFDSDDLIYIAVSNASIDRKIVTGDSDFGCNPELTKNRVDIKNYLETQRKIIPLTPEEANREVFEQMSRH